MPHEKPPFRIAPRRPCCQLGTRDWARRGRRAANPAPPPASATSHRALNGSLIFRTKQRAFCPSPSCHCIGNSAKCRGVVEKLRDALAVEPLGSVGDPGGSLSLFQLRPSLTSTLLSPSAPNMKLPTIGANEDVARAQGREQGQHGLRDTSIALGPLAVAVLSSFVERHNVWQRHALSCARRHARFDRWRAPNSGIGG